MNNGTLPLYMVFNKNLMTDRGPELPYDIIFRGDWTYDCFLEYITGAASDLDGNGKLGPDDRLGYANNPALTDYMVFGYNVAVVERTEKGTYTPSLENEHLVSALQRIVDFNTFNPDSYSNKTINPNGKHVFVRGNTLFSTTGTSILDLRSIDVSRYYDFAGGSITPVYLLNAIKSPTAVVSYLKSVSQKTAAKAEDFFSVFFEKQNGIGRFPRRRDVSDASLRFLSVLCIRRKMRAFS